MTFKLTGRTRHRFNSAAEDPTIPDTTATGGRKAWPWGLGTGSLLLGFVIFIGAGAVSLRYPAKVMLPDGLTYIDLVKGHGAAPRVGQKLSTPLRGQVSEWRQV